MVGNLHMMVECYGASRPQAGRSANGDAIVIEHNPLPYAAVFDGAGDAEQAARRVLRSFKSLIKDQCAKVADLVA